MSLMNKVAGLIAIAAFTTSATAGNDVTGKGYIGAGIGLTTLDVCDDASALGATSCDDDDTGFRFFGGYNFSNNIAIEAGYVDFGEITASDAIDTATIEATAFNVVVKGSVPVNDSLAVFGKIGFAFWDADATVSGGSGFGTANADDTDLTFGIGAEYSINSQFGVRGEWDRTDFDGTDVDMFSINAVMKF